MFNEKTLFLDIETTGLSARSAALYLIGVVYLENGKWKCTQCFGQNQRDEVDLLKFFRDFAKDYDTLVHFNGTTFDLPFLKACAKQYHLELGLEGKKSIDLYNRLKPLKDFLGMSSLKQKAFEERVGYAREDKFDGAQLIEVYKGYQKMPNKMAREILQLHNRDDLFGMQEVSKLLRFERIFDGSFGLKSVEIDEANGKVHLQLSIGNGLKAPVSVEYENGDDFKISMKDTDVNVDLFEKDGQTKLFFPDYKNYFYLPNEDKAVHKSVGVYVDSHFRRKATFETAYQWVSLDLLKSNPQQLNVFLHSLFEHYIFGGKKSK